VMFGAAAKVMKSATSSGTPVASGGFVILSIKPEVPPKVAKLPVCVSAGFILKTLPLSNAMLPEDMVAEPVKFRTPVMRLALAARGTLNKATKPNAKTLLVIESSFTRYSTAQKPYSIPHITTLHSLIALEKEKPGTRRANWY
jgi:hypothetical protein